MKRIYISLFQLSPLDETVVWIGLVQMSSTADCSKHELALTDIMAAFKGSTIGLGYLRKNNRIDGHIRSISLGCS